MSKLGTWSTTPGNNNSTPPDGWPEGQAPSTVNDCAREMMASVRTVFNDTSFFDNGNTPSFLTATTFSMGSADVATFHVGRRVKLFDATTLYGTIDSVSATFVSVRLDGNNAALTANLSSVAVSVIRANDNALPDVVGTDNMIINGNMEVWQRGNGPFGFSTGAAGAYTADRWLYAHFTTSTVNVSRAERSANSNNVPTLAQAGQYLNSSLRVSVSATDVAIAAGEYAVIGYRMEGYDWRAIAHRPLTLGFWAFSTLTGTYCIALHNTGQSVSFIQNYTLTAASTWSHFNISIPEATTVGTWDYSAGRGVVVDFVLAAGSSWQGGAGNWTAGGSLVATSSQVNFVGTTGTFKITGVDLHAGGPQPLATRPYPVELAMCQRYYWRGLPAGALNFNAYTANSVASWPATFPVTMRATPTLAVSLPGVILVATKGNPSLAEGTPHGYRILGSASVASINASFDFGASDFFEADAEL